MKLYDIEITPTQLMKAAEWIHTGAVADVQLAVDGCMLVVSQGDEKSAWDTDGSVGSEEYVSLAPLSPRRPVLPPTNVRDALGSLLAYVGPDEQVDYARSYEDGENTSDHIFRSIVLLDDWLAGRPFPKSERDLLDGMESLPADLYAPADEGPIIEPEPVTVWVVEVYTSDEEPAVFAHQEYAEAYGARVSSLYGRDCAIYGLLVCDDDVAKKMVTDLEPEEEDDPDTRLDASIYDQPATALHHDTPDDLDYVSEDDVAEYLSKMAPDVDAGEVDVALRSGDWESHHTVAEAIERAVVTVRER